MSFVYLEGSIWHQVIFFWCFHKWSYSYTLNFCWLGKLEMWNSFIIWSRKFWLFYISSKILLAYAVWVPLSSVHYDVQLKVKWHYQHSAWPDILLCHIRKFIMYIIFHIPNHCMWQFCESRNGMPVFQSSVGVTSSLYSFYYSLFNHFQPSLTVFLPPF